MSIFKDRHPLHTENEYAQSCGFEQIVMHGNILNGFLSYFVGEAFPMKDIAIASQSINFHHPCYLGDQLRFLANVVNISEAVGLIELKFIFRNDGNMTVAKGRIQLKTIG